MVRRLEDQRHEVIGVDMVGSRWTSAVGSIVDRAFVRHSMAGVQAVVHAATLHKPHVVTHGKQDFVDTNITGTLNLLEEATSAGIGSFVFTSTTSVFGDALVPRAGAPAAWITEDVTPIPKNIYGVTKAAAEDLCQLFHRNHGLACLVLRVARFFPEEDDSKAMRDVYADDNIKANEYLFRRADIDDIVDAHILAIERAPSIGFRRYVISATTPFLQGDLQVLISDAPSVVRQRFPGYEHDYGRRDWRMFPSIGRVYVNARARKDLGWRPRYDFAHQIDCLRAGTDPRSPLAQAIGAKGYHDQQFADGPFPVE